MIGMVIINLTMQPVRPSIANNLQPFRHSHSSGAAPIERMEKYEHFNIIYVRVHNNVKPE